MWRGRRRTCARRAGARLAARGVDCGAGGATARATATRCTDMGTAAALVAVGSVGRLMIPPSNARFALVRWDRCQAWDWTHGHQVLCRHGQTLPANAAMLVRVAACTEADQRLLFAACALLALQPLVEPASGDAAAVRAARDAIRAHGRHPVPSEATLYQLLGIFSRNNFDVFDEQLLPWATGMYPIGALLNHACTPNVCITFTGSQQVRTAVIAALRNDAALNGTVGSWADQTVRAVRDIAAGEELCIAYVDLAHATAERQAHLLRQYGFQCACDRCTQQPGFRDVDAHTSSRPLVAAASDAGERLHTWADVTAVVSAVWAAATSQGLQQMPPSGTTLEARCSSLRALWLAEVAHLPLRPPSTTSPLPRPHAWITPLLALVASVASSRDPLLDRSLIARMQQFLDAAVDAGHWQRAVPAARWLVLCYTGCYGLVNPLVGLQLFSLAKIEWNGVHVQEAQASVQLAVSVLSITHGTESDLVAALRELHQTVNGPSASK